MRNAPEQTQQAEVLGGHVTAPSQSQEPGGGPTLPGPGLSRDPHRAGHCYSGVDSVKSEALFPESG